jgi:glutamate 5-kinase
MSKNNGAKQKSGGQGCHRMVVKLGTSLLTGGSDRLDRAVMSRLVEQVARLHKQGMEIIVVSSGAMAAGRHRLGLVRKIRDIPFKQVLCSVGQSHLMFIYEELFGQYDIPIAQALLTKADLADRSGYLNARNTLLALLQLRVISIVNENDVVAVDELDEAKFGDNDNLSAMVANLVDADLLVLLTDIAGLHTADPRRNPDARLISEVEHINAEIESLADKSGALGIGGMVTKIEAARLATASGVTVVIADGREPDVIVRLAGGEKAGTRFLPTSTKLESRKRWLLSGLSIRGKLVVDPGAAVALQKQNRSLLAAGIKETKGDFDRGDLVDIYDAGGQHLGCGLVNYSSDEITLIKGAHSGKIATLLGIDFGPEVVHRDNLAVIQEVEN